MIPYLPEIAKIIEAGIQKDSAQVEAYARQLADLLVESSENEAAKRIRDALGKHAKIRKLTAASAEKPHLSIPVDHESKLPLADVFWPADLRSQVILEPLVAEQVHEYLSYCRQSEKLIAEGLGLRPSLLLFGPPGCGKTLLARFVAQQLELPLVVARIDTLISSFLGSTAKNIRLLFDAVAKFDCVLLLDEVDAIAKLRDDQNELGELKRVVTSLLQNLDALGPRTSLIAATNHEHLLDSAIWRRFSYKLRLQPPGPQARRELFALYLASALPADQLEALVDASDGFSHAEIQKVSMDTRRAALLDERKTIDASDVLVRIAKTSFAREGLGTMDQREFILRLHRMNPKVFTTRRLGELLHLSHTTVSKTLKAAKEATHA